VVVARVDDATTPESFGHLLAAVRGRDAVVTWAMTPATLARLSARLPGENMVLALDGGMATSRRELRRGIDEFRRVQHTVEGVLLPVETSVSHGDLLVETGVRVVGVDRFVDSGRGSRRPPPHGWQCRSSRWGLWEVRTAPASSSGLARWLPWAGRMAPGSLAVERVELAADPTVAAAKLARTVERYDLGSGRISTVRLAMLADILGPGAQTGGRSVLRAA
jgi:hypothetical protein